MEPIDQQVTDNILKLFSDMEKTNKRGAINNIIFTTPTGKSAFFDEYQKWNKKEESK